MLYRQLKKDINNWISNGKDALLVTGARQIGKTYLIKECLEESEYEYVEINFIEQPELIAIFENTSSTEDFIMRLSLATDKPLIKHKTIIFFDEIQEVKDIVTKIKFLAEDYTFKYVLSGSLLGVELVDLRSAPVGYLTILDMYPMGFYEFLISLGIKQEIIDVLKDCYINRKEVDTFIHTKIMQTFRLYLIVGGMPEAVSTYLETNNLRSVSAVHKKIKDTYGLDFTKYEKDKKLELREIYNAMPSQLNNQTKRFKLNEVKKGIEYDKLESSFLWLKDAGVALPVYNVTEPKLPLDINEKRNLFKLFFSDVGLLTSCYSDHVKLAILNEDGKVNNGALFENVVAQELKLHGFKEYYFNSKKLGELDFVIELNGKALPLEIKSGKDYKRHSAINNVLKEANYSIDEVFIFHNNNVEIENNRIYLPIYMIMFLENTSLEDSVYKINLDGLV